MFTIHWQNKTLEKYISSCFYSKYTEYEDFILVFMTFLWFFGIGEAKLRNRIYIKGLCTKHATCTMERGQMGHARSKIH